MLKKSWEFSSNAQKTGHILYVVRGYSLLNSSNNNNNNLKWENRKIYERNWTMMKFEKQE